MATALPEALRTARVPDAVTQVLTTLNQKGYRAFLVGGCVRDMLRGQEPKDFDIATSATPEQVQACFSRVIPTGIEHGTVTVISKGTHVEVTTFRSEGEYLDGRRPSSVAFETDITLDLGRRDFTVNAMAFDHTRLELVDPFDGQADLKNKVIRCVRSATERFTEDGLRAMRAVRFATVLDFEIEPETEAAIRPTVPIFRKVAIERINQELSKLLVSPHVAKGWDLLVRTGLLDAFWPEADGADSQVLERVLPVLELRLAAACLSMTHVRDVMMRLKFPNKTAETVAHLVQHQALPELRSDADIRRWLAGVGVEHVDGLMSLLQARQAGMSPELKGQIHAVVATKPALNAKALAMNGKDIMTALNVAPSPIVGVMTRKLVDAVLEDPTVNTREGLNALLLKWSALSPIV